MIAKVSITPDCFGQNNDSRALLCILIDIITSGILIADFDKKRSWKSFIDEYSEEFDPQYSKRIVSILKALNIRSKIVRLGKNNETIDTEIDWLRTAVSHSAQMNLNLIMIGDKFKEDYKAKEKCMPIEDVPISPEWIKLKRMDLVLLKKPDKFSKILKTFLPYTSELKIIDPYFDDSGKCKLSIEIFAKWYRYRENMGYVRDLIEIHTTKSKNHQDIDMDTFKFRLKQMLEGIVNEGKHTIKVFIWKDNNANDKFHDRLILTKSIGISSTHSFDVKEDSMQEMTWSILSEMTHELHEDNFGDDPKFTYVDDFSITRI